MAQKIGQKDEVVALRQEIDGEEMTEGMGMDDAGIDPVFDGQFLELLRDTARGDLVAEPVEKHIAAVPVDPGQQFVPQTGRKVDPADPAAFGKDVKVSVVHLLDLQLDQFADPCPGRSQGPYNEIPSTVLFSPQPALEILVIIIADHVVQEGGLRDLDHLDLQVGMTDVIQVLVDPLDAQVHRLGFVALDQPGFIKQQILLAGNFEP